MSLHYGKTAELPSSPTVRNFLRSDKIMTPVTVGVVSDIRGLSLRKSRTLGCVVTRGMRLAFKSIMRKWVTA